MTQKQKQKSLLILNHNELCFYNETDLRNHDPEGLHISNTTTSVNLKTKLNSELLMYPCH